MNTTDKTIFLETAWDIACELIKSSIWQGDSCTWQGYSMEAVNGKYEGILRTFGADIYSGTSGIALFLAALYSEKKDAVLLKTIEGCLSQMTSLMHTAPDHGFYSGKPGIASALIKIGSQLERSEIVAAGIKLLESIPTTSLQSYEIDVISGAAGTIPVLLDVYKTYPNPVLLDKAIALGDLLYHSAEKNKDVWSWRTVPSQKNLTGFSHGSSGIALALLQLYEVTENPQFLEAATGGFNYERQSFDATQHNWPDFRDGVSTTYNTVCGLAWCHGAPGIALSRLKANRIKPDSTFEQEMFVALTTTKDNVYHNLMDNLNHTNYSLCHGIAGNAEILLDCSPEYYQLAETVGTAGIYKYKTNRLPWPTGVNSGQYTPGLMMGIAGTGYFYLRLLDPEKHKSLLLPGC
ncbi:lanthionine synthetase LanC family protein [Flavobacterium sp. WV_118_3]|uniref:lanthionine synthetase LanC family protein n=1 Tax=Flavobacterium sp. WV_118_3 TaxID=3151764 RepID=UPI00321A10C6